MTTSDRVLDPSLASPPRRVKRNILLIPGLIAVLVLGAAACGSQAAGSGSDVAPPENQALAFYQCLRDNGLDVADPTPGSGIAAGIGGDVDPDDPGVRAAIDGCRNEMGTSGPVTFGGTMGENMADNAALLAFVDCMREAGVDMLDPEPDGRLPLPVDFDPDDDAFQAATRGCTHHLGGGGVRIGSGGGGGAIVGGRGG